MTRDEIRAAWRQTGLSKSRLALDAGLSINALARLDRPDWNPSAETIEAVAKALEAKMHRAGESPAS